MKWTDLCNERFSWLNIHLGLSFSKGNQLLNRMILLLLPFILRKRRICTPVWGWKNWPLSPSPSASSQILQCHHCNACRNSYISGQCGLCASVKTRMSLNVQGIILPGEPGGLEPIFCAAWASPRDVTVLASGGGCHGHSSSWSDNSDWEKCKLANYSSPE